MSQDSKIEWTEDTWNGGYGAVRIGKKKAGRLLDGRTWDEMPTPFFVPR